MGEHQPLATIDEALAVIQQIVRRLPTKRVSLQDAAGMTLSENIVTDVDSPPFDKAMMDGFAVQAGGCQGPGSRFRIAGELGAGQVWPKPVAAGDAVRINTGAPMPTGTDAVAIIEHVEIAPDSQWIATSDVLKPGANVGRCGSDVRRGDVILEAGVRMGPAQIAAAAAAGAHEITVYRSPKIAILVTGDELVPFSQKPDAGQIRNSNGPCLQALVEQAGGEVLDLGTVGDDRQKLAERVRAGLAADVFCISGGMSMGQHDHVPGVLRDAGVELKIQKIAIKPGRPTAIGLGPAGQIVFGLPGNPVSCFVCFLVFVRAALEGMTGRAVGWPASVPVRIDTALRAVGPRVDFIPVQVVTQANGERRAKPVRYQGSGDPFGLARANGLMIREANTPAAPPGIELPVVPLDHWPQE